MTLHYYKGVITLECFNFHVIWMRSYTDSIFGLFFILTHMLSKTNSSCVNSHYIANGRKPWWTFLTLFCGRRFRKCIQFARWVRVWTPAVKAPVVKAPAWMDRGKNKAFAWFTWTLGWLIFSFTSKKTCNFHFCWLGLEACQWQMDSKFDWVKAQDKCSNSRKMRI